MRDALTAFLILSLLQAGYAGDSEIHQKHILSTGFGFINIPDITVNDDRGAGFVRGIGQWSGPESHLVNYYAISVEEEVDFDICWGVCPEPDIGHEVAALVGHQFRFKYGNTWPWLPVSMGAMAHWRTRSDYGTNRNPFTVGFFLGMTPGLFIMNRVSLGLDFYTHYNTTALAFGVGLNIGLVPG